MKRIITVIAVSLSLAGLNLYAQTPVKTEEGRYTLTNGEVTMTVDAQRGGKIISFRYADIEILSQTRFPNSFGSTFWTSPQSEWN